jgi:hypothetical protein
MALRTRRSPKIGWGTRSGDIGLPSLGMVTFIAASIGVVSLPVMICALGFCARRVSTCSGEKEAMKSISPALNAAISVTGSLITRMMTLSTYGWPGSKYFSKRSISRWLPFTHSTNRKGPQPTMAPGLPCLRSSTVYFWIDAGDRRISPVRYAASMCGKNA